MGVKVEKLKDKRIKMSQPYLIEQILEGLGFNERTKIKRTPAVARKILHQEKEREELQTDWEYRRIIGQLNFLEKSTRPDIAYAVHQCARFSSNPKSITQNGHTQNREILDGNKVGRLYFGTYQQLIGILV